MAAVTAVGHSTSSESSNKTTSPRLNEKPAFNAEFCPPFLFSSGMIRWP